MEASSGLLHPVVAWRLSRGSRERSVLHVYYDFEENIPYFRYGYASRLRRPVVDVSSRFIYWCDPRPVQSSDLRVLEEAVSRRFGGDVARKVLLLARWGLTLVNPGGDAVVDHALEFMVNGVDFCIVYHDTLSMAFDAAPRRLLTALLYVEDAIGVVSRDGRLVRVSPNGFYAVVEGDRVVGVAADVAGHDRPVVLWEWEPLEPWSFVARFSSLRSPGWRRVYEANLGYIEVLVEKTRRAARWLEEGLGRRGLLAFSGGKDSVLAAMILDEVGSRFEMVYTHIEHGDPEKVRGYVEEVASRLGVRLHVIEHRWERVREHLDSFGMPCRGYRWCTQVFKLRPQIQLASRLYGGVDRVVNYTGSRMYETPRRSVKPPTHVDVSTGVVAHSVPYKWPRLLEYLALAYRYRVRLLDDYEQGFERISCVACPHKSLYELRLSEKLYPSDFTAWKPYMRSLLEAMGADEDKGMRLHLWRLALLPLDLRDLSKLHGVKARPTMPPARAKPREAGEVFRANVTALKPRTRLVKAMVWAATAYCTCCGLCQAACPANAISLPFSVDPSKCTGCLACLYECPAALREAYNLLQKLYGTRRALDWYARVREESGRRGLEKAVELEEKLYSTRHEHQP